MARAAATTGGSRCARVRRPTALHRARAIKIEQIAAGHSRVNRPLGSSLAPCTRNQETASSHPSRFDRSRPVASRTPRDAAPPRLSVLRSATSQLSSMGGFFPPPPALIPPAGPSRPGALARPTFNWYHRYEAPPNPTPKPRLMTGK